MRVTDLVDRELPLTIAGRQFILRRIRLRTVLQILVRFSDTLHAFQQSGKRDVEQLLGSVANDDLADLYAFLLSPYDPLFLRQHLNEAVARELMVLVASVNDLERIWASLAFSQHPEGAAPTLVEAEVEKVPGIPPIPALLAVIDLVAERYKLDPMKVLEWPYEAFLTMTEVMESRVKTEERVRLRELLMALGVTPELADQPGVTFSPVQGPQQEQ